MTSSRVRRTLLAVAAATLAVGPLASALDAQAVPTGTAPVRYYRGVIGINPLGIPLDIIAIEAEGAVAPGITIAGALSHVAPDEDRFTSGDIKARYYPAETALDGFSVGLGAGFTTRSGLDQRNCVSDPVDGSYDCERNTVTGPTLSVLADYNFLLGERRRFFIGTGIGAKRWMVSAERRHEVDADRAWVFARFLVGLAF